MKLKTQVHHIIWHYELRTSHTSQVKVFVYVSATISSKSCIYKKRVLSTFRVCLVIENGYLYFLKVFFSFFNKKKWKTCSFVENKNEFFPLKKLNPIHQNYNYFFIKNQNHNLIYNSNLNNLYLL
jgi:hypothetical protein